MSSFIVKLSFGNGPKMTWTLITFLPHPLLPSPLSTALHPQHPMHSRKLPVHSSLRTWSFLCLCMDSPSLRYHLAHFFIPIRSLLKCFFLGEQFPYYIILRKSYLPCSAPSHLYQLWFSPLYSSCLIYCTV